jgi:outer membrane protein assembly factor BamD (BamD/ComL family)
MFCFFAGCHAVKELKPVKEQKKPSPFTEASERLVASKKLLAQGNFDASLEKNEQVLSLFPGVPLGDEALYTMGLTYAHYKNPKKDFRKSRLFFEQLIKDYPSSPLVLETRIWIGVLEVIEKSKEVDIKIEEMKKELSK